MRHFSDTLQTNVFVASKLLVRAKRAKAAVKQRHANNDNAKNGNSKKDE